MELSDADLLDPFPDIHALFCHYNDLYFGGALGACSVNWSSRRMTLCAGVCRCMKLGGCEIRLSEPLLKLRPVTDLKNTLLHEMIHAFLFLTNGNTEHDDHGSAFQKIMKDINESTITDHQRPGGGYHITIYHKFIDEVNNYRTHHWECQKCGDMIKRAMNREPSFSDCYKKLPADESCNDSSCHWHQHKKFCGGQYLKTAEPAGYQDKRRHGNRKGMISEDSKSGSFTETVSNGIDKKKETEATALRYSTSLENFYPILKREITGASLERDKVVVVNDIDDEFQEVLSCKRRRINHVENSNVPLINDVEKNLSRLIKRKRKPLENTSSHDHGNLYDVIIKWKNWYAHEIDEDNVESLIDRRKERRRLENLSRFDRKSLRVQSPEAVKSEESIEAADHSMVKAGYDANSIQDLVICNTSQFNGAKVELFNDSSCENLDLCISSNERDGSLEYNVSDGFMKEDSLDESLKFNESQYGNVLLSVKNPYSLGKRSDHGVRDPFIAHLAYQDAGTFLKTKMTGVNTEIHEKLEDGTDMTTEIKVHKNNGLVAACPVCREVFGGDISEGKFNEIFNKHVDQCVDS